MSVLEYFKRGNGRFICHCTKHPGIYMTLFEAMAYLKIDGETIATICELPLGELACKLINQDYDNMINMDNLKNKEKSSDNPNIKEIINKGVLETIECYKWYVNTHYKEIERMINLVFVKQNDITSRLSSSQKYMAYKQYFSHFGFDATVYTHESYRSAKMQWFVGEKDDGCMNRTEQFYRSCEKMLENEYVPNYEFHYCARSIQDMIRIMFYEMAIHDIEIKKCANCGKYFVPIYRSDTIYCNNLSPQDNKKTCKQYGAMKSYQNNLKTNEAMGLYRKIYMSKQMLSRRNPDIKEYADSFEKYKEQSKQWKLEVKAGAKTEAEYIEWLKSVKEKKVL